MCLISFRLLYNPLFGLRGFVCYFRQKYLAMSVLKNLSCVYNPKICDFQKMVYSCKKD